MITYNSENALIFTIPEQFGYTIPTLEENQLYSLGGYGIGITSTGIQQTGKNGERYPGIFVKTAPGTFGILLGDEFQPHIYRGQNKDFQTFYPSYARLEDKFAKILANVQREEFKDFFVQTSYYKRCHDFNVLDCKYEFDFEAIFQHYGFKSSYVDITKDLLVALFFAYTYVGKDGAYYPVSNFEEYNPTLYVSVISAIEKEKSVIPISLQMLNRPMKQMAMAVKSSDVDLKSCFIKYELPKNSYIALDIYERFCHGALLFPKEPVADISKQILDSKELNRNILEKVCLEQELDVSCAILEFEKQGYLFSEIDWKPNEEMHDFMNNDIDTFWIPFLDNIGFRRISHLR